MGHVVKYVTGLTNITPARTVYITGNAAISTPWQTQYTNIMCTFTHV